MTSPPLRLAVAALVAGATIAAVPVGGVSSSSSTTCDGSDVGTVDVVAACGEIVLTGRGGTNLTLSVSSPLELAMNACNERGLRYGAPTSHACAVDASGDSAIGGVVLVHPTRTYSFAGSTHPASLAVAEHSAEEWQTLTNEVLVNRGFDEVLRGGIRYAQLEPGEYQLHLLGSSDADLEVSLELLGATGSVRAAPANTTEGYEFVTPDNELPGVENSNWSAGHEFTSTTSALTYYAHITDSPVNPALVQGGCAYAGPLESRELAYRPGCPEQYVGSREDSGQGSEPVVNVFLTGNDRIFVVRPAGTWPMGYWHNGAGPLAFVGDFAFIVPLGDA